MCLSHQIDRICKHYLFPSSHVLLKQIKQYRGEDAGRKRLRVERNVCMEWFLLLLLQEEVQGLQGGHKVRLRVRWRSDFLVQLETL